MGSSPSPRFWSSLPPSLPAAPGVYWFLDPKKKVLYVGKAKNLRLRLGSYRLPQITTQKTKNMVAVSQTVKWRVLDTEWEALVTEANLVHRYQPPYNILLKDDKSPLYIIFTQEKFPKVLLVRKTKLTTISPKPKAVFGPYPSSTQAKSLYRYLRRLFPFCTSGPNPKHHACLYRHLGLCPGVCDGTITAAAYRRLTQRAILFLQGKRTRLVKQLEISINHAVKKQQFEAAQSDKQILQSITNNLAFHAHDPVEDALQLNADAATDALIKLRTLLKPYLMLPGNYEFTRIEGYDIANLQGQYATASLIVMQSGRLASGEYRHFKIKTVRQPNDPAMLAEVVARRIKHLEWPLPQLIILDGGRTQVSKVLSVMPIAIPVIGLAKHPDHLVIKHPQTGVFHSLKVDHHRPEFQLLTKIRDETHRFSRRLHHHLIDTNLVK